MEKIYDRNYQIEGYSGEDGTIYNSNMVVVGYVDEGTVTNRHGVRVGFTKGNEVLDRSGVLVGRYDEEDTVYPRDYIILGYSEGYDVEAAAAALLILL